MDDCQDRLTFYKMGGRSVIFLTPDILPETQVSKPLKLLQIKNRYIKFTPIALYSQTFNREEANHESKKSGKNLA